MNDISNPGQVKELSNPIQIPRWKRLLDMVLILVVLPLVLPLAAIIGVLIFILSPGPILFKQERVGIMGRRFMCLKFRTMHVSAATDSHQGHLDYLINSNAPMAKLDARGDSRIIPLGLLLRSSGLDELPQLINVQRGEMSLVGPRPCMPYEYARYLPWQMERFSTVPGLTGLWQVSGKNRTTFKEMIELDIEYARTKSLRLDLAIILKTVPVILGQMRDSFRSKRSHGNQSPLASQSEAQTLGAVPGENQTNERTSPSKKFRLQNPSN